MARLNFGVLGARKPITTLNALLDTAREPSQHVAMQKELATTLLTGCFVAGAGGPSLAAFGFGGSDFVANRSVAAFAAH
jgi:hypothetical protein